MDKIQPYELNILMDNINVCVKNDWMLAREIMWSNLTPWSKKSLKAEDIMKLPWDDAKGKKASTVVTKEIKQKMLDMAKNTKSMLLASGAL